MLDHGQTNQGVSDPAVSREGKACARQAGSLTPWFVWRPEHKRQSRAADSAARSYDRRQAISSRTKHLSAITLSKRTAHRPRARREVVEQDEDNLRYRGCPRGCPRPYGQLPRDYPLLEDESGDADQGREVEVLVRELDEFDPRLAALKRIS